LENAKSALRRLSASSREITAPVTFPSSSQLEVRLVPSTLLERLEEYRSDENKWISFAGVLLGAALALSLEASTGGTMTPEAWILLLVLWLGAFLAGWSAWSFRERAKRIKAQLLNTSFPQDTDTAFSAAPAKAGSTRAKKKFWSWSRASAIREPSESLD
jgi:hypothetical protein